MKQYVVQDYEEAVDVIREVGILPLAQLVPNFPSLDYITDKENWHTSTELDPWLWRAQFPVDGVAAYGKFLKKKSILISRELLPTVRAILGSTTPIEDRYADGLVSREAMELFQLIQEEPGIDTRVLRKKAGMKEKEKKKDFDKALVELQENMDIVVSGTKEKTNELGEKNGWSSTSYETMENWASRNDVKTAAADNRNQAIEELTNHFEQIGGPELVKSFRKLLKF
jgi:hypothetical protein